MNRSKTKTEVLILTCAIRQCEIIFLSKVKTRIHKDSIYLRTGSARTYFLFLLHIMVLTKPLCKFSEIQPLFSIYDVIPYASTILSSLSRWNFLLLLSPPLILPECMPHVSDVSNSCLQINFSFTPGYNRRFLVCSGPCLAKSALKTSA